MKIKKNFKLLSLLPSLAVAGASILSANVFVKKETNLIQNQQQSLNSASTLTASESTTENTKPSFDLNTTSDGQYKASKFYVQNDMPVISNANGPVLLSDEGRTIAAYDWYGNPSWFLSLNSKQNTTSSTQNDTNTSTTYVSDAQASYYTYSNALSSQIKWEEVGTKIVDTAYLTEKDFLYVLTDTSYLFLIQSKTGVINSAVKLGNSINKISFIDFNNSLYGWDSTKQCTKIYDIDTQKLTIKELSQSSNNSAIKDKHLFDILPLDVGYNIALISDSTFNGTNSSNNTPSTLKAIFMQDDGSKFTSSTGKTEQSTNGKLNGITGFDITPLTSGTSGTTYTSKDIYSTTLKKSGSNILIVGSKIYNIVLNKSAMENTTITELNTSTTSTDAQSKTSNIITIEGSINSAFIDNNNLIYIKDNSKNIYQLTQNNNLVNYITGTNGADSAFSSEDEIKKARIFPVLSNENSQTSLKGIGYLASPTNFAATGFTNGSLIKYNFTTATKRPSFSLKTSNYTKTAPSAIDSTNIKADLNTTILDQYNTSLYADDISGSLYIKTRLNVVSWYNTAANATTSSYVIGKWNCAKISEVTTWVSEQSFKNIANGLFAKRDPNQISDADVTKYADQILNLPSVVTSSPYKKIDIIVTNRKANEGKITLKATIKYQNANGTIVSYVPAKGNGSNGSTNEMTYTVKSEAKDYKFKFYGGEEGGSTEEKAVDIASLGTQFTSFKNTLPSLIKPTSDNLEAFIETQDKYPTDSRRVITVTNTDDAKGEITIKVHYNNLEATTDSTFSITYTGLATTDSMNIKFKGEATSEVPTYQGKPVFNVEKDKDIKEITTISSYIDYNTKLATQITANELNLVYESNLKNMGFNPTLSVVKDDDGQISSSDAEYGSILVELDYTKSYSDTLGITLPQSYWDKFGLKDGKVYQRYIGFLPIGETYGIELKSYNSPEIQSIVQNHNIDSIISKEKLISTLNIRGYNDEENKTPDINILNFGWDGEDLYFTVHAQSQIYNTVSTTEKFVISWSPKFAAVRERNLIISVATSLAGVTLVATAVSLYIFRRNKIRKLLK